MLEIFRKKKNLFLWILMPFIIISFSMFYGWSYLGGTHRSQKNTFMKVGNYDINYKIYYYYYQKIKNFFAALYGGRLPVGMEETYNFKKLALETLINDYYNAYGTDLYDYPVSDEEVSDRIANFFSNVPPDKFDKILKNYLASMRLREKDFYAIKEIEAKAEVFKSIIQNSGISSELDIYNYMKRNYEKRKIGYVLFSVDDYIDKVPIDEKSLKAYYEKHKEDYKTKPKYQISFITILPKDLEKEVEVTKEDIQNYYNLNIDKYKVPKKLKLKRIFLKIDKKTMNKEKQQELQKKMEDIRKQIVSGANFGELAAKYSEGPEKDKKGDYGWHSKDELPKDIANKLFSLKKGDISPVIKTSNGIYLFKVEDEEKPHFKKIEEVKDTIIRILKAKKAKELAKKRAEEIKSKLKNIDELKKYAKEHNIKIQDSELFTGAIIPKLGYSHKIFKEVQNMKEGEVGSPVSVFGKYIVYALKKKEPSKVLSFKDAKSKVIEDYKYEKAFEMAKNDAQTFKVKVGRNFQNFKNVATEYKKKVEISKPITFQDEKVEGIGKSKDLVEYIFLAKQNQIGPIISLQEKSTKKVDKFCVWYCAKILPINKKTYKDNWGKAYSYWSSRYGNGLNYAMLVYLEEKYPMKIYDENVKELLK